MPEPRTMVQTAPPFHMANAGEDRELLAKEVFEVLQEMSQLLNTGLSPEALAVCVQLCERGAADPRSLANLVNGLRTNTATTLNGNSSANTRRQEHAER
ncbi:mitotic-spindle organizing protein 1-like [Ixodes scapularis]|uniref:Mitotic-spindle organizing protein 1 n=1 Tax=Ixodes scapularis TaxID=6945 RepID=B7Q5X3_IXOSC|nr:mitotic-spindle organizing protein 1 [Ixodes scapularis]XP_042145429.1 mitotic-spindle organizing protein 1-like [Ixodes scapularis]EEC14245.1 conserved hypothetical protein [Ixodes scapularis]|eukprot:XP_002411828.1 conserved hypothetical protein [Ixodes scapularis]